MPDYFHSALRGDQIHESKIKVLPAGSAFPVPEWEGQFLAVGNNLYYSVKQNSILNWIQPTAFNTPSLPSNTVTFESGLNPPTPRTTGKTSGIIYLNNDTKDIWYLSNQQWIKLGTGSSNTFEIIPNRATGWSGNYFGLLDPSIASGEENCLLISKFQANKKYYLAVKCPPINQFLNLATDNNNFYLELWRGFSTTLLSTHLHNTESLAIIDTALFTFNAPHFRLGMYVLRNQTKQYINFLFDFEARLLQPRGFSQISYGY